MTIESTREAVATEKGRKKRKKTSDLYPIPNRLMNDAALTYSARRVGNALYSKRSRLGQCMMSLAYLAKMSSCSIPTVRKAVEELETAGYIRRCRNYQYSEQAGRVVYARTTYVCALSTARDYTLVSREVFSGLWHSLAPELGACTALQKAEPYLQHEFLLYAGARAAAGEGLRRIVG